MSVMSSHKVHFRIDYSHWLKFILNILLLISTSLTLAYPVQAKSPFNLNENSLIQEALPLLESMTPQERIGQLFLITFNGNDASTGTAIEQLITNYHIGGVILTNENDNFSTDPEILQGTLDLNIQLQQTAWEASQKVVIDESTNQSYQPNYIPLLIGISQEGDGYHYDQIFNGLTTLPNQLTLGSTWQPELAAQAGIIAGRELSSLGFNLLFSPSLDILEIPHPESDKDLGSRTFGGDPFWVSEMGKAYIQGLHLGSQNQLAVVSKHFPGYGSADRTPEEEVATVRKSLSDLKAFDLIPFFAVTGNATSSTVRTDAILTSHIRLQGFQESSPRVTTRPVSIDQSTLQSLLQLPEINQWLQEGGLIISDDLGNQALRRYLDLNSQSFDPQRITLTALLAGNDMVYISDFTYETQPDNFTATIETIRFLVQKYSEDTAFAQRVDEAVSRILALKYKLYGSFLATSTIPSDTVPPIPEDSSQISFNITRNAASLINPTQGELDEIIPDPPKRTDRIVFITDTRTAQQCSKCPEQSWMPQDALQNVVLRKYGPNASRQVVASNLSSFTLEELDALLNNREGGENLARRLALAHWIVFSMLDNSEEYPTFETISRLLARRPDLLQGKKVIVFAFNAPYFLDATDISRITAYYALFNKTPQAIEMAAYLLFQELPASSASSVSIPGIDYSLNEALFPDPDQTILLEFDLPNDGPESGVDRTTPLPPPVFNLGDMVNLKTGIIVDSNGRPVPDGTPVEFTLSIDGAPPATRQVSYTVKGTTITSFLLSSSGMLEFQAQSEQAVSNILTIEIIEPQPLETETPTQTPEPTATIEPSPTPTFTPEPTPIPAETTPVKPSFLDWIIAIFLSVILGLIGYRLAITLIQVRWGLRMGFLIIIGSLLTYTYLTLQLPGSDFLIADSMSLGVFLAVLIGAALGVSITFLWRLAVVRRKEAKPNEPV
jgi:beta-N-acetylhexosaminidase